MPQALINRSIRGGASPAALQPSSFGATGPSALYEQAKIYIRTRVRSGEWNTGEKIPSENDLVKVLGISRMTVNRALRELSQEGELVRRAGVGTFVAEPRAQSMLLRIAQLGNEIRARGHRYEWTLITKSCEKSTPEIASGMELPTGRSVFHVVCLHRENGIPVQLEDRYVNPECVPEFLEQTFESISPSEYLLSVVPADEIEHIVDAVLANKKAKLLKLHRSEPCLQLTRRTWSGKTVVTFARLLHPASRYRLGCRFHPQIAAFE